ncbi:MAG: IS1595 family transposase [Flavobacteriales bacterium]|nr:IS1595 family transposase [Flavobacteriales bacterium]
MESRFKSLSIFEFQQLFPDDASCLAHLSSIKWKEGFACRYCGHSKYCGGERPHDRQCTSCNYTESPTAHAMFHKVKFPLVKAFWIVYYLASTKKGMSSTELSRKLELRQKTCWLFKRKVMQAMKSSGDYPMQGTVEVDEAVVGGQEESVCGRANKKKRLVVFAIERKGKGVSRMYAKVIPSAHAKNLGGFMMQAIDTKANVRTDGWTGYAPLKKQFENLTQEKSLPKGKNFKEMHRIIMGFKGWLRGVHHHARHLQAYLDEYCFRFNRSFMKEGVFENLLQRMMRTEPCPYKALVIS